MTPLIRWARLPLGLASALLALTLGLGAAGAAPRDNTTTATDHDLQRGLRTRQAQLQGAATQIALENQYAATMQATFAALMRQGHDTAELTNGLAQFRNRIAYSQALRQDAMALMAAHAGFDAHGNVVDKGQAQWTLETVHDRLQKIKQSASTSKNELNDLFDRYNRINGVHISIAAARDAF